MPGRRPLTVQEPQSRSTPTGWLSTRMVHRVPLSSHILALLREARALGRGDGTLPSRRLSEGVTDSTTVPSNPAPAMSRNRRSVCARDMKRPRRPARDHRRNRFRSARKPELRRPARRLFRSARSRAVRCSRSCRPRTCSDRPVAPRRGHRRAVPSDTARRARRVASPGSARSRRRKHRAPALRAPSRPGRAFSACAVRRPD